MATRRVPGLGKSTGMKGGFRVWERGLYALQCTNVKVEEDEAAALEKWQFRTTIMDGPTQKEDGVEPTGRTYTHFLTILTPEHEKFEEFGHIGVDELYSMAAAWKVPVSKSDGIDPDAFVSDNIAVAEFGVKTETIKKGERKGEKVTKNVVYSWKTLEEAQGGSAKKSTKGRK